MTKVEVIIRPSTLESLKDALHEIGVDGMTILEVRGLRNEVALGMFTQPRSTNR
jgi:nitrogen regulatory protein PII